MKHNDLIAYLVFHTPAPKGELNCEIKNFAVAWQLPCKVNPYSRSNRDESRRKF
jgi:hypothetical protein